MTSQTAPQKKSSNKECMASILYVSPPSPRCLLKIVGTNRTRLESSLQKIHTTANQPTTNLPPVPPELIEYVDTGRNPDIYTREIVEVTRKANQLLKGKMEAFSSFRDVLAHEMGNAMPELAEEIERVVFNTGGSADVVVKEEKM
jgi:mediator of RNA polymerase II transcription subunit 10